MAQKPDGKSARTDRVTFTRGAAERIADAVREIERGNRDGVPYAPSPRFLQDSTKVFRVCTFTGSWPIGTIKTVTFKASSQKTASALNLFWPVPDGPQRDCAIGKDGTAWYLLVPRLYAADAATAATITTASLQFETLPVVAMATASTNTFGVSIATCATATT